MSGRSVLGTSDDEFLLDLDNLDDDDTFSLGDIFAHTPKKKLNRALKRAKAIEKGKIDPTPRTAPAMPVIPEPQATADLVGLSDTELDKLGQYNGPSWADMFPAMQDPDILLDKAEQYDLDPTLFVLDDSDQPKAGNVVDWILGQQYAAKSPNDQPFAKQALVKIMLNEDICFMCSDMEWMLNIPVDARLGHIMQHTTLLEHGVCPDCARNRLQMKHDYFTLRPNQARELLPQYFHNLEGRSPVIDPPYELIAVCGQRSGKTVLVSMAYAYHLHRYLTLFPAPARFFGQTSGQLLTIMLVAVTATQARDTLWSGLTAQLEIPWFRNYHKFLREIEAERGIKLLHVGDRIAYKHRALQVAYGSSDYKRLRGLTAIGGGIDELGLYHNNDDDDGGGKGKRKYASVETYFSLTNALATVRMAASNHRAEGKYDVPDGIMLNIGSPFDAGDPLMTLLRKHGSKSPRYWCLHAPTWEMNPQYSTPVAKRMLAEKNKESATFARDFGAQVSSSANTWFPREQAHELMSCVLTPEDARTVLPQLIIDQHQMTDPLDHEIQYIWQAIRQPARDKYKFPRIISLDGGETNNSFAITLLAYNSVYKALVVEQLIEVVPGKVKINGVTIKRKVHHDKLFNGVMRTLLKAYNIAMVCYDRWQSVVHNSLIRTEFGVDSRRYSLKPRDFDSFLENLLAGRFLLPPIGISPDSPEFLDMKVAQKDPNHHLIWQILNVRRTLKGVGKPAEGTDDLFRCLALANALVLESPKTLKEIRKQADLAHKKSRKRRRRFGGRGRR